MAKIDKLNLVHFIILLIGFNLTISMEQEFKSQESLDIFGDDYSYLEVQPENQKEWLAIHENCMPILPDEVFYNIIKEVVKPHIDKWDNIFEFDAQFNKDEFNKDITNMLLICKRFKGYKGEISIIVKRLKIERLKYLEEQIKEQSGLSKEEINEKLLELLNQGYVPEGMPKEVLQETVKLIWGGADANITSNNGTTALIFAAYFGDKNLVELLITSGSDVNAQDNDGDTALIVTIKRGHKDIVELLIDAKADINIQDNNGYTVLMWAIRNGHSDVVNSLLQAGANFNIAANNGCTTLVCAISRGHKKITDLLILTRIR